MIQKVSFTFLNLSYFRTLEYNEKTKNKFIMILRKV